MIHESAFRSQLVSARQELNIPEEVWVESEGKVRMIEGLKQRIDGLAIEDNPNISEIVQVVRACIKNGLIFQQFQRLYQKLIEVFNVLGKMTFLLLSNAQNLSDGQNYFFSSNDVEIIMSMIYEHRPDELKDLQSKEAGDMILLKIRSEGFPKNLP